MKITDKKTALIVDDDIDSLAQLNTHLQNMGFSVIAAESQKEAEDIINKTKPDLAEIIPLLYFALITIIKPTCTPEVMII